MRVRDGNIISPVAMLYLSSVMVENDMSIAYLLCYFFLMFFLRILRWFVLVLHAFGERLFLCC